MVERESKVEAVWMVYGILGLNGLRPIVSGTVKMTPSGIRKLTPHFVNLHLTGGAYAEVGNIYGNTDIKQAG